MNGFILGVTLSVFTFALLCSTAVTAYVFYKVAFGGRYDD